MSNLTDTPKRFDLVSPHRATDAADSPTLLWSGQTTRRVLLINTIPGGEMAAGQLWFWSASWQDRERQATAEIEAGSTTYFASGEEFLTALHGLAAG